MRPGASKTLPLSRRPGLRYGRVFFVLRDRLAISTINCLLLDIVETLSRRTGRCYASREYLAAMLGISVRSLHRCVDRLEQAGLLERLDGGRHLRPSSRWFQAKQTLVPDNVASPGRTS